MRNVRVRMRDGVTLATTVVLPRGDGPCPVVLVRTAYNRVWNVTADFAGRGMALVCQDCRGRYDSDGEWWPFTSEENDGADTLEWISQQPWCNGKIGMFGDSYLAFTQFHAVRQGAHRLTALNPRFMSPNCWKRAYYCDGAFSLALTWSWLCFECAGRTSEANTMPMYDVAALLRTLPLVSLDERSGREPIPYYRDYVRRFAYDAEWDRFTEHERCGQYTMPVLLTAGWYDYYPADTIRFFQNLTRRGPTREVRDSHRLLIGPWTHGVNSKSTLGELDFGPNALQENDATSRWLDCMLKERGAAAFQKAPIRVFVMGRNEWRDADEWPPKGTRFQKWYLHSGGAANGLNGNGRLDAQVAGDEKPDRYVYDPAKPVPTLGGNHSVGPYNPGLYELAMPGPFDQRPVERREDVLVFTSEPLAEDTEVIGPVTLKLHAATSARDTDFVARLVDVYPDGRAMNITEGVIRARFRDEQWERPTLLDPGRIYEYAIDLQATANVFLKGHRVRLDITSSNFPLWDRNLNTGNDPGTDTELRTAEQTIFHDRARPSCLVLPVVPRG